jgi:antitoxin ParD1/3/4
MAESEGLKIELPDSVAETVREAVETGEYASTTEVVCDALRVWEEQRALRGWSDEALKKAWDEGKASGIAGPLDIEAIIARAKAARKAGRRG